ncbi:MAG: peptidoglycan DD-metalloendopeptidase family protein [Gammaproteobacteria bacterium]|nr:peptidoglycan DD-metalloendopeptidase family protein [Pseudomonadales bacterium]MCP5347312.1 peptidoglycan DD-metalloendopeptidase family protein [Pseudomonadales bacterium]
MDRLNTAITRIEAWLEQARLDRPETIARLEATETRLAALNRDLDRARQAIADSNEQLSSLQRQQQTLNDSRQTQTEQVRRMVRAAYQEGRQSTVKLILNQEDPAAAARLLHYYRLINEARLEQVREYRRTLAVLADTEQALQDTRVRLTAQQQRLDASLAEVELERQARQQTLAELDASIDQRDSELEKLLADRTALEALLAELSQAFETIPVPGGQDPFAGRRGLLPAPVAGDLLIRFGERYGNGDLQRQGIVIGCEAGTPVRAVHSGTVVFANWLRGSGLLIILDHGDGYLSLYGHNQSLTLTQGDRVEAGAVVAIAGNSGGNRETGVYFEIRYNGRPQDPLDWLAAEN